VKSIGICGSAGYAHTPTCTPLYSSSVFFSVLIVDIDHQEAREETQEKDLPSLYVRDIP
jgi:hypothetical protein